MSYELDRSASLYNQWPSPEDDYNTHLRYADIAVQVLNRTVVGYDDLRLPLMYAALSGGDGQKASVDTQAEPATAKSTLGDMIYGRDNRTEINDNTTPGVFYGHEDPLGNGKIIQGELKGMGDKKRFIYLNEIGNIADEPSVVSRLWDSDEIDYNGQTISIKGASIYTTRNFPNGRRVKKSDSSLESRFGSSFLLGDLDAAGASKRDQAIAERFNKLDNDLLDNKDLSSLSPLIPPYKARQAMQQYGRQLHRITPEAADFRSKLYVALNNGRATKELSTHDARKTEAMFSFARALHMVRDMKDQASNSGSMPRKRPITPLDMAYISAAVLPTAVELNDKALDSIMETTGKYPTNTEYAIILRRHIARTAIDVYLKHYDDKAPTDPVEFSNWRKATTKGKKAMVEEATFANVAATNFNVDDVLDNVLGIAQDKKPVMYPMNGTAKK